MLDAGCGAGLATLALAQQGYEVEAIDAAPSMVAMTEQQARQMNLDQKILIEMLVYLMVLYHYYYYYLFDVKMLLIVVLESYVLDHMVLMLV